jgi:hypothetical protein
MQAWTRGLLAIGAAVAAAGAVAFGVMVTASRSEAERVRRELDAALTAGTFPRAVQDSTLQVPKITARFEEGAVELTLHNDGSAVPVVIERDKNRLILEYESLSAGPLVRSVALESVTLTAGESGAPIRVPLEGRWRSMKIRFEHRDAFGIFTVDGPSFAGEAR